MEKLEARIVRRLFWNCHRLAVSGDPSGNALPHAELEAVDGLGVRIFRRAQNQLIPFEHIDQARIALHQRCRKFDDAAEHFVKSLRGIQLETDLVQNIDV
jgi:hypothetical protein